MYSNDDLIRRDLSVLWHPCTQMKDHESLPLIPIKRGEGVWLEDFNGKRYLDAVSSWWVNLFGHANPRINARVKQQVDQLEHVILAGFTHEPVVQLSEQLVAITPDPLTRVFYADNGSSGVEVALKMSFHYWLNKSGDDPARTRKTKFVTLANSYHGETLAALAVGNVELYKQTYQPLLMTTFTAPSPDAYLAEPGESAVDCALRAAAGLEDILANHGDEICALILEPLVQCAGSMRMYHPAYLKKARELCDRYQVHLIADEIAVGFGRTGTLFACEQAAIVPDFLCLSKGLTGGYLPLCAVLTIDTIYNMFYDDYASLRGFLHSHSYTGNPLACAAALATLAIFRDDDVINANQKLIQRMAQATAHFRDHSQVADVRQTGMILAIEMVRDKATRDPFPWQERRGLRVYRHALERGALLRPLGNVVYLMPPYVITAEQIDWLAQVAWDGIQAATVD